MIRRFLAVFHARNMEFFRDRSSLAWNFVMPVMLVLGMAWIFSGGARPMFKVGVVTPADRVPTAAHPFLATRHIDFFPVHDEADGVRKVAREQIDMLLKLGARPTYWVNPSSPKGYILERMLRGSGGAAFTKATVAGETLRYIDWLLPGILAMNMMFSCLFGVGYVVVRYRKNGFLKRLNATPLRPIEFLAAQIASRLMITLFTTAVLFVGARLFLHIRMDGSYLQLFAVAVLGAISMIALALVVAARATSEELASGLLNVLSWPMMLLSGVWFSMEGTNHFLQSVSELLPLTQVLEAARATMLDGAGWSQIAVNLLALAGMSAAFMVLGAAMFRWRQD